MSPNSAFTVEIKMAELSARREATKNLGAKIDRAIAAAERPETCSASLCTWLTRRFSRPKSEAGLRTASDSAVNRALFGLAGKAVAPASKLDAAANSMRARVEDLEKRAVEQRAAARKAMQGGNKQAAMRALKKCKMLEAQAQSASSTVDAVEAQVDLLAQAAAQKELSSALTATSKSMKKQKKLLSNAEAAVDDAIEVKDLSNDLNAVFTEFATNDVDEDELMGELEAMMGEEPTTQDLTEQEVVDMPAAVVAAAAIEAKYKPKAKAHKSEEKAGLLDGDSAAQMLAV